MNRNLKNILSLPLVLACAFFISSCSKDEVEIERPEKVYYDTAQRRMRVNNYFGAIESLQRIETQYPFGKYAFYFACLALQAVSSIEIRFFP